MPWDETDLKMGNETFRSVANSRADRFYYLCTPYTKYAEGLEEAYQMASELEREE